MNIRIVGREKSSRRSTKKGRRKVKNQIFKIKFIRRKADQKKAEEEKQRQQEMMQEINNFSSSNQSSKQMQQVPYPIFSL